jgi:mannose-6-phosphate isomerase-like protein (cupin superfamily)
MSKEKSHYQVHVSGVQPAQVTSNDGWRDLEIRFMITGERCGSESVCWWRTIFRPSAIHEPHYHPHAEEVFYILRGHGIAGDKSKEYEVGPGTAIFIPRAAVHWFRNDDPEKEVELVGCYSPADSLESAGYVRVGRVEDVITSSPREK